MKKAIPLLPLFRQFIKETETGKRLKKNGERIKPQSVRNYSQTLVSLEQFSTATGFELRLCDAYKLNKRELQTEKQYWKKFYRNFVAFMYGKNCHDNYVGSTMKIIRVFFTYLKYDKDFATGDFQRLFYIRKEETQIFVLSPQQFKFLIHDKMFEQTLSPHYKRIKDIFVFGCSTGLRFSDLFLLTNKNFEQLYKTWYLKIKSMKTKTFSQIKLPQYAVDIYLKYQPKNSTDTIFGRMDLSNFNKNLKILGEKADFIAPVVVTREKQGKPFRINKKGYTGQNRFCDCMTSHMMRRTAITTLLILGMPEHLVRQISGHSTDSSAFHRYVHYAQAYIDTEIDKVHQKLEEY